MSVRTLNSMSDISQRGPTRNTAMPLYSAGLKRSGFA